jgi:hypothetical protein
MFNINVARDFRHLCIHVPSLLVTGAVASERKCNIIEHKKHHMREADGGVSFLKHQQ